MSMSDYSAEDRALHEGIKKLPVWGFVVIVVIYVAVLQGISLTLTRNIDVEYASPTTTDQLWRSISVGVAVALAFVAIIVTVLGWWRPVWTDRRPVQRWVIIIPILMLLTIAAGINYGGLSEKTGGFVVLLLVSALMVGFGEEIMFRGIGVTTFRVNGYSEGKVALWSTVIFGVAHASNVFSEGSAAALQVAVTIIAGYFFYLIRRRTGGVLVGAVIHGLWDFGLISSAIVLDETYAGAALFMLTNVVIVVILLVRRHRIEPAPAQELTAPTAPA
jgi:membrane protease YdiL (CAAX protease family)